MIVEAFRISLEGTIYSPPLLRWSAVETRVALTFAVVWVSALAAWQARRSDFIRASRLVLAHVWEGMEIMICPHPTVTNGTDSAGKAAAKTLL